MLAALASELPLPVKLDVTTDQLPPPVAAVAYFVCAEALTNVVKHAAATHVTVAIGRRRPASGPFWKFVGGGFRVRACCQAGYSQALGSLRYRPQAVSRASSGVPTGMPLGSAAS